MEGVGLVREEEVAPGERGHDGAAEDQRRALKRHRETEDGGVVRGAGPRGGRVRVGVGVIEPEQRVDRPRNRQAEAADVVLADEADARVRRVAAHLLAVRDEERVAVLEGGDF